MVLTCSGLIEGASLLEAIPVLRPQLPSAERVLPYLRRIDNCRIYSNWGPLSAELENRLARHLRLAAGAVVSASSGTAALVGAILATAGRATHQRPLAMLPAFTFVATASAVQQCGYTPYLADIDATTWTLDPKRLAMHHVLDHVGVVVPVAPFGRPVAQDPWHEFSRSTGVPVVIDGAASLDRLRDDSRFLGSVPVAISFHATKAFATGEGGCVVCTDTVTTARVGEALNFGFRATRESTMVSINGKMSEYHAAVGLAEHDSWCEKLQGLRAIASRYRKALAERGLDRRLLTAPEIGASYTLFRCVDEAEAARVIAGLMRAHVDFRLWYGRGLHRQAAFAKTLRDSLDVTDAVAPLLLGIPYFADLSDAALARVVDTLAAVACRRS